MDGMDGLPPWEPSDLPADYTGGNPGPHPSADRGWTFKDGHWHYDKSTDFSRTEQFHHDNFNDEDMDRLEQEMNDRNGQFERPQPSVLDSAEAASAAAQAATAESKLAALMAAAGAAIGLAAVATADVPSATGAPTHGSGDTSSTSEGPSGQSPGPVGGLPQNVGGTTSGTPSGGFLPRPPVRPTIPVAPSSVPVNSMVDSIFQSLSKRKTKNKTKTHVVRPRGGFT